MSLFFCWEGVELRHPPSPAVAEEADGGDGEKDEGGGFGNGSEEEGVGLTTNGAGTTDLSDIIDSECPAQHPSSM
jgi:hypothetical protein